jgi:raffinose/stachyose/melibiose transport system permease protein
MKKPRLSRNQPRGQILARPRLWQITIYVFLFLFSILLLSPLTIIFSSSLRPPSDMRSPLLLFTRFSPASYIEALAKMRYLNAFINSILTTGFAAVLIVLFASMASYPIARIKNRLSRYLYYFFIAGLIVPSQMVIVPVVQMIGRLHFPNTRFTPVIMFITCSMPFSVFLYAGFMKSVPVEIEESSFLDGAGLISRFFRITFPLLQPATVSVIITQGLWIWNDYFYPMMFITKAVQNSLPVAMIQFLGDRENPAQWNILFASCVLCALPIVLVFAMLQRQFINGIAAGAIKG